MTTEGLANIVKLLNEYMRLRVDINRFRGAQNLKDKMGKVAEQLSEAGITVKEIEKYLTHSEVTTFTNTYMLRDRINGKFVLVMNNAASDSIPYVNDCDMDDLEITYSVNSENILTMDLKGYAEQSSDDSEVRKVCDCSEPLTILESKEGLRLNFSGELTFIAYEYLVCENDDCKYKYASDHYYLLELLNKEKILKGSLVELRADFVADSKDMASNIGDFIILEHETFKKHIDQEVLKTKLGKLTKGDSELLELVNKILNEVK